MYLQQYHISQGSKDSQMNTFLCYADLPFLTCNSMAILAEFDNINAENGIFLHVECLNFQIPKCHAPWKLFRLVLIQTKTLF